MILKTVLESGKMRDAQQLSLPAWSPYLQEVQYYTNDVEIAITQMIISKIISKNVCAPDCSNRSPIKPCCHLPLNQPTGQSVFLVGARIRNFNGSLTARVDWGGRGEKGCRIIYVLLGTSFHKQKQTFEQMFDFWVLILVSRHSPSDWKEFSKQLWLFTETNHIAYMVGMNIVESLICDAFAKRGNSRNQSHWTWFIVSFSAKAFKVAWLLS